MFILGSCIHTVFQLSSLLLFNGLNVEDIDEERERQRALQRGYPSVLLRLVLCGIAVYIWTQFEPTAALAVPTQVTLPDRGHELLAPLRLWLQRNELVEPLCSLSTLLSELISWAMLLFSVLGSTTKPVVAGLAAYAVRAAILFATPIGVVPADALWAASKRVQVLTAFSSLYRRPRCALTRPAAASSFVSVRILTATTLLLLVWKWKYARMRGLLVACSAAILLFQLVMSLSMRTNFSADLLLSLLIARAATLFARRFAVFVDANMP